MLLSVNVFNNNNNNNNNNCQIIDVAILDDGRVRAKEDELGSRKISRSRERNSKDVGHKDKGVVSWCCGHQ